MAMVLLKIVGVQHTPRFENLYHRQGLSIEG